MSRTVRTILLDVVVTVVLALLFLVVWRSLAGLGPVDAVLQSAQRLFLFMDVGLLAWVVMLAIAAIRRRPAGAGLTLVFAAVGAMLNLLVVIVVGFAQLGSWAELFVQFAVEAGLAFLVAAAIAVLLVHRLILRLSPEPERQP
jgi:hypothetical protein